MRLIDADKVKKCLEYDKLNHCEEQDGMEDWELLDVRYSQGFNAGIDRAIYYLENKNMQVAERHGHWIHGSSSENIRVTCSECGYKVNYFWDSWQDALYCPKCGARMDGEA